MPLSLKLGLIYLISEILLTVTRRSRSQTGTKQDRSTLGVLWLVIFVSIAAGIFVTFRWPEAQVMQGRAVADAGIGLFVAGLCLRWWAIITLGRFFTVDVTIEKDHEVVERGPFRLVRHPSYSGVTRVFRVRAHPRELGRSARYSRAHLRRLRLPDESRGGGVDGCDGIALHRLHAADETTGAIPLLS